MKKINKPNGICALVAIIATAVFMSNCKTTLTKFSILSVKPVDITQLKSFKRGQSAKGEDMTHWIGALPLGSSTLQGAVEQAIAGIPGAVALVDGTAYGYALPLIAYTKTGYIVEGEVLIDPKLAAASNTNTTPYAVSISLVGEDNVQTYFLRESDYHRVKNEMERNNLNEAKAIVAARRIS